jgi:hypothetical protein
MLGQTLIVASKKRRKDRHGAWLEQQVERRDTRCGGRKTSRDQAQGVAENKNFNAIARTQGVADSKKTRESRQRGCLSKSVDGEQGVTPATRLVVSELGQYTDHIFTLMIPLYVKCTTAPVTCFNHVLAVTLP